MMKGGHVINLTRIVQRKDEVLAAEPCRFAPLRQAAESLSRANIHRAHAEVINEGLMRCCTMLYEDDAAGNPVNVDRATGAVLIPAPWTRHGGGRWGLRRSESDVLRKLLTIYQGQHDRGKGAALFLYDDDSRRWCVNLVDYPNEAAAMQWVRAHQVTVSQWRYYAKQ